MKSIVIYNSSTGFTKKYAEWISEEAGCECVNFKKGSKMDLSGYDAVVFGSWSMAGGFTKLAWFKKKDAVSCCRRQKTFGVCGWGKSC